jgi:hypothetical protein
MAGDDYWLRGNMHGAILGFGGAKPVAKPDGKPRRSAFEYSGGPEAYLANVQRLLATITVRAHIPIRVWAYGYYARESKPTYDLHRPHTAGGLTLEEALTLPIADTRLQPTLAEIQEAQLDSDAVAVLRDRIPWRLLAPKLWRNALMGFGVSATVVALVVVMTSMQRGWEFLLNPTSALALLVLLCIFPALQVYLAIIFYRNVSSPTVVADNEALTLRKFNAQAGFTMLWEDARAWAIVAPEPGHLALVRYAVWSENQMFEIAERSDAELAGRVKGDRRVAYCEQARWLHALIAARTGLPLREISARK